MVRGRGERDKYPALVFKGHPTRLYCILPMGPTGDFVPHCGAKQTLKLKAGHTISVVVEDKTVI